MRRTALKRRTPLRSKPRRDDDKVTPELRLAVLRRDQGCVAPRLDPELDECRGRWGERVVVLRSTSAMADLVDPSALTLDHVRDHAMIGKRAPSDEQHLVTLCWHHHLDGWATAHRDLLRAYLRAPFA